MHLLLGRGSALGENRCGERGLGVSTAASMADHGTVDHFLRPVAAAGSTPEVGRYALRCASTD